MRKIALLGILLLAGCASAAPRPKTSGYNADTAERENYDNFFYGTWVPHKSAPEN